MNMNASAAMTINMLWEHNVKCEFCDAMFEDQDSLKKHIRLHSRRKPYKCDECGAKFSYNSTLEWHKKSHTGEMPFKCDECGDQFLQNSMLVWHKRKHRMGDSSQGTSLVMNMSNIYHQQNIPNISTIFSLPNVGNQVTPMPISVVAACSSETHPNYPMVSTLSQPTTSLTMQPCVAEEGSERKLGEEGTFRCDFCGAVMMHSSELKLHMNTKHNMGENNPFHILAKQQQANGEFTHRKKIIIDKPYKCDLCGAGFNTEGHLKSHRQKHLVDRPYKCEKCGLTFCEKAILESHERRHQAERPFKCERCGAAFFRESHLQRHIKRHTGELI